MQKTTILYYDHSPILGGAAISLLEIVNNLDPTKYMSVISCNSDLLKKFYQSHGIKTSFCHLFPFHHTTAGWYTFSPKSIKKLFYWRKHFYKSKISFLQVLNEINPDIVHFNSITLAPYSRFINKKRPVIVHVREQVVRGYFGLRKRWLRNILSQYVDKVLIICDANKRALGYNDGMVLCEPVDIRKYSSKSKKEARKNIGIGANDKVVLYMGDLRKINGPVVFAKAMQKIAEAIPDVTFLMPATLYKQSSTMLSRIKRKSANTLGIYSVGQIIQKEIDNANLQKRVIRSGFIENIEDYFIAADVVAIPFIQPHFARPVLEAGAASVPVVASRIDGITEVVQDGVNGILFEPNSHKQLAEGIIRCLSDSDLAIKMGNAGYDIVLDDFDSRLHAERISAIYDAVSA